MQSCNRRSTLISSLPKRSFDERLEDAKALLDSEPDAAHGICVELLNEQRDNPLVLYIMAAAYSRAERYGLAHTVFQRLCTLAPNRYEAWNNVGMCQTAMSDHLAARKSFFKANDLTPNKPEVLANIALTYLDEGDFEKAEMWGKRAIAVDPNHAGARGTLGFAQLALGRWTPGWENYGYTLGGKFRKRTSYGDEPLWDGSANKRLVIYGEQGLGDEIMYASCIPDIACEITLDCDKRLEGLFRRSFPDVEVHGTRRDEEVDWIKEYDANCPIGLLPQFMRPDPKFCPKTPYLIPDPERVLQWKILFASYRKPVIGLCWTGGSKHNHPHRRAIDLPDFQPLFDQDAVFVSLQYKDGETHPRVLEFPRATRTPDYDDTAGLVAALDHVIGIHTTVHHLAGALGVPATILVPDKPMWIYAGEEIPWYRSTLHRKRAGETWKNCIRRLNVESICRFRSEGIGGVSHVLPIGVGENEYPRSVYTPRALVAG